MTWVLVGLLKAYRLLVSPVYGQRCRYYPSCSAYALDAVQTHGAVRGSWLAVRRLGRCHPWTPGGVDFVPPRGSYRWWGLVEVTAPDHVHARTGRRDVPTDTTARRGA